VLSKYHEKRGNLPTALAMLKKAEHIGETADLFFRLALIYAKIENYQQALHYIEKAMNLNPTVKKYVEFKRFILDLQERLEPRR
jgi:tetratricopeptide (TPR) repeat protein